MKSEQEKKEVKEFADVYLGFVYRLAVRQYEEDYREMRQVIEESREHDADQPDKHGQERRLSGEKLPPDRARGQPLAKPAHTQSTQVPKSTDNNNELFRTDDTEIRFKKDKPSLGVYTPPMKSAYRKDHHILRPAYRPAAGKLGAASPASGPALNSPQEQLDYLREAEEKKRLLERELRLLESSISKTKNEVGGNSRDRSLLEERGAGSFYEEEAQAASKRQRSRDYLKEHRVISEPSRKDSGVTSALKKNAGLAYLNPEASSVSRPYYVDNAEFIRRLNQEKKEREVAPVDAVQGYAAEREAGTADPPADPGRERAPAPALRDGAPRQEKRDRAAPVPDGGAQAGLEPG